MVAQWGSKRKVRLLLTQNTTCMHSKTDPNSQLETQKRLDIKSTVCVRKGAGETTATTIVLGTLLVEKGQISREDGLPQFPLKSMLRQILTSDMSGLGLDFPGPEEKILTLLIANFLSC